VLPLVTLAQLGFIVAFDTLLVRSVLVPALVLDVGPRVWWPSRPAADPGAREAGAPAPAPDHRAMSHDRHATS
jgi:RND superfamily putative drug exporter